MLFGLSAVVEVTRTQHHQGSQFVTVLHPVLHPHHGLGEPPLHNRASTTFCLLYCLGRNTAEKMQKRPFISTQVRAAVADLGKTVWIRVWRGRKKQRSTERPRSPAVNTPKPQFSHLTNKLFALGMFTSSIYSIIKSPWCDKYFVSGTARSQTTQKPLIPVL